MDNNSIVVESFNQLLRTVTSRLAGEGKDKPKINVGDVLRLDVTDCPLLTDLFFLGRLFSLVHLLRLRSVKVVLVFGRTTTPTRITTLDDLGFFKQCSELGIEYEMGCEIRTRQTTFNFPSEIHDAKYWYCLVPISRFGIHATEDEEDAFSQTDEILRLIINELTGSLGRIKLRYQDVWLELSNILHGMLRELVLNTIMHSGGESLWIAMTLSRENATTGRPHRPGLKMVPGINKFDFLVSDFGCGVFPTVWQQLYGPRQKLDDSLYLTPTKFNDSDHLIIKRQEEAFLTSIFADNLTIRKGRKSKGLFDVGSHIEWFDGLLNYRSGRTELHIAGSSAAQIEERDHFNDYLPGVIASAILPSSQLKLFLAKTFPEQENVAPPAQEDDVDVPAFQLYTSLPEGLFGGEMEPDLEQRGELYAREFLEDYAKRKHEVIDEDPALPEVDLRLSKGIRTDFLDSLIQELCKTARDSASEDSNLISKILFTNTRRRIARALARRNSNSFLMMDRTFCTFLDESDTPHFVGIPRITARIYDVETCLMAIYAKRTIREDDLRKVWRVDQRVLTALRDLIRTDETSLFYRTEPQNERGVVYHCHDASRWLIKSRRRHIEGIIAEGTNMVVPQLSDCVVLLRNGSYVSNVIDFASFWNQRSLFDCAKLFLNDTRIPLISNILAFMGNGDRLASMLQRVTAASTLIIVDPHNFAVDTIAEDSYALVIDAIYPGDEDGYLGEFVRAVTCPVNNDDLTASASRNKLNLQVILAMADFRQPNLAGAFAGVQVISLLDDAPKLAMGLREKIHELPPSSGMLVIKCQPEGTMPYLELPVPRTHMKTEDSRHLDQYSSTNGMVSPRYDRVELSAEFWHNASSLGIISPTRTGRETRNITFYENNERIIENYRTRTTLEKFVMDFVRDKLQLAIDVIIYPSHPVGAYLAQLVAAQLNRTPLTIPLRQREYGGPIEISSDDRARFLLAVTRYRAKSERVTLNAIAVDDSVISGQSLTTMIGLASNLGLRIKGVLVILNRLTPDVSAAISALPVEFGYHYRLHMPPAESRNPPDDAMKSWSAKLIGRYQSHFVGLWIDVLRNIWDRNTTYFLRDESEIRRDFAGFKSPTSYVQPFDKEYATCLPAHELRHIIEGLILHREVNILDFYTRLAVAYNFLEDLTAEQTFWKFLTALTSNGFDQLKDAPGNIEYHEPGELSFVRKLTYLVSFSRHVRQLQAYKELCSFIGESLRRCLREGGWKYASEFVCDLLLAMGAVGDETLIDIGMDVLSAVAQDVLDETEFQQCARHILGAYSWSLGVLTHCKNFRMSPYHRAKITETFEEMAKSGEEAILCFDVFKSLLTEDAELRGSIGVDLWIKEEQFAVELAVKDNSMIRYLAEAPGYTCTLNTVRVLCRAHTVLLFAKNVSSDPGYYLRAFDSKDLLGTPKPVLPEYLKDTFFSEKIQSRMKNEMFFFSDDSNEVNKLDAFSKDKTHRWMFGAAIANSERPERYFMVVGYKLPMSNAADRFFRTAMYRWFDCEDLLSGVLPEIQEKYVISSAAWHSTVQTIRSVHLSESRGNARRELLVMAMTHGRVGGLIRQAVALSDVRPLRGWDILKQVRITEYLLKQWLDEIKGVAAKVTTDTEVTEHFNPWPIKYTNSGTEYLPTLGYMAFNTMVLQFVFLECLCNALAYYKNGSWIEIMVSFVYKDREKGLVSLTLSVSNEYDRGKHPPQETSGVSGCKAAANAAGGSFDSSRTSDGRWLATLCLPGHKAPDDLIGGWLNA